MKKLLRFTLTVLLSVVCGTMWAQVVTFDPATDKGSQVGSSQGEDQVTKDGVTISVAPTGSFGNGQQYRVYKGATFTVTSTVGNITKVEITCSASGEEKYGPGCFTDATPGSYNYEGTVGTWTGNAASFSMTASTNQVRMTEIKVTIGDGSDPGPGPEPGTPSGSGTLADPWNAVAAQNFTAALPADEPTEQTYYIKGKIAKIANNGEFSARFGNATFYISDDGADANTFYIFRALYLENQMWVEGNTQIKVGDEVIICGKLVNYKGTTPETVQNESYIYSLNGKTKEDGGTPGPEPGAPSGSGTLADPWNAVAAQNFTAALPADEATEQSYYIKGKIAKIANNGEFSARFGNATFYISDDGADANTFYIFRTLYLENQLWVEGKTQIKVGDEVIICGKLVNYKGTTPETVQNESYIYSLNGKTKDDGGTPGPGPEPGTPSGSGTLADPWNAVAAQNFTAALTADTPTEESYYIKGKIAQIASNGEFSARFGNATFYISDDGADANTFYIYRTLYLENQLWVEGNTQIKVGDEVIICGKLVNYKGTTPETVQNESYIYSLNGKTSEGGEVPPVTGGIVFDPTVDKGSQGGSSSGEDQVTKNGVTIAASPTGSFGNGQQYRVYKGSTFTVSSTAGNIVKIEISCTAEGSEKYGPGCFTDVTPSTYTYEGTEGTWTGSATSVSMTASSNQVRMTKVVVTLEGGEVPAVLTISGTTPFQNSTVVTITPSNADYAVYYTVDGSDPGSSSTAKTYNAPFTITETTTVKAVEEDLAGELSSVVEKTFVKEEMSTAANIAEFKNLAVGTEATLTLTDAEVLYASGRDVYVRDASGAIDFYNTGLEFTPNMKLNGSLKGIYTTYNNLPEFTKSDNTSMSTLTVTNGAAPVPVTLTIPEARDMKYVCDLVKINGVVVGPSSEGNNSSIYKDNEELVLYDKFHIFEQHSDYAPMSDVFDFTGILVIYKDMYEIYPTVVTKTTGINEVTTTLDLNAPMYNLKGQRVDNSYHGVVIQNGKKVVK